MTSVTASVQLLCTCIEAISLHLYWSNWFEKYLQKWLYTIFDELRICFQQVCNRSSGRGRNAQLRLSSNCVSPNLKHYRVMAKSCKMSFLRWDQQEMSTSSILVISKINESYAFYIHAWHVSTYYQHQIPFTQQRGECHVSYSCLIMWVEFKITKSAA